MRLSDWKREAEEYREIDRDAGGPWVITTVYNGIRFFATGDETASDILERVASFALRQDAEDFAKKLRSDVRNWRGFNWHVDRRCAFKPATALGK